MNRLRAGLAALFSALYWGTGALVLLVLAFLISPLLPRAWSQRLGQGFIRRAFQGFTGLLRLMAYAQCEFIGFERLADLEGGAIIAPNHPAMWDAVYILSRVPGLTCILKASLLRNPLLTGGAKLARFIPNDPPRAMVKSCVAALARGERLLFFPEGTRTRKQQGVLNPFVGGLAIIARHADVPVVPVYIWTDHDYLSKGWPVWRLAWRTVHIRMEVGEPVRCGPEESTHAFLERLHSAHHAALSAPPSASA